MKKLYILSSFLILCFINIAFKTQAVCNLTVTLSSTSATVNVGGSTGTITATAHNNVGAVTYGWAPCATLNFSTGASVISTPLGSTTYTVTAFDASGCSATATVVVNVVDPTIPGSGGATTVNGAYTYSYSNTGPSFNSMTGATVLATNSGMTNQNYTIDLSGLSPAFNFVFPGGTFDQFGVNTNGYIYLGAAAVATDNQPIASTDPCTGIICGWGVPLQGYNGTGGSGSNIEYVVSGTSPNRVLTVQWTKTQFQTNAGEHFNMQIVLYETTNVATFIYSNQYSQFVSGQVGNVQIGLRGATNADYLDRTGSGGGGFGWWPSQTSAGGANTSGVAFVGGFAASYIGETNGDPCSITYTPACIGTRTTITSSGATDLCPSGSVTLTASSGASYQWYMNGTLTDSIGQTFSDITTAGTYAVLAAPSVGCGIPSYVTSVTTNATVTPSVTITSNPTPLCSTNAVFTATPTNGGCVPTYQWLLNGSTVSSIALNASTYTNNALNPNDQVQVIMTTDALCASQATDSSNIIINTLPIVAPIAGGATKVCLNSATTAFTDATVGGTWSIMAGTGTASISAGGVVTGLTAGSVTVAYTITGGSCSNVAATILTVDALPTLSSLTGTDSVCVNSATQLSEVNTGGTWSSGTTSVATVDGSGVVTGVSGGSSIITYTTAADANGCINSITTSVTVNALPTVASITGTESVCNNSTTQLSDFTTGGAWSSGTTSVATVDGTGLVTGVSNGSSIITYTTAANGSGCINSTTASVTVNALPTVASITGTLGLCSNSTSQLNDATTGGSWSSGTTSVATIDGSGLVSGVSNGSSIITYTTATDGNGCSNSTTATVTVNTLPIVASITGTLNVCSNSTIQLGDATTGGSWSSDSANLATVDTSGNVTGVAAGTAVIIYTTAADGNGCAASASASVTIKQTPAVSISNNTPLCSGGSVTLSSGGGTGYSWTGPNGFTSSQESPGITNAQSADSGSYTVTVTGANGCTATSTTSVIVNQLPTPSPSNNGPLCFGSALDLSSGDGTSYAWTGPDGFTSSQQDPVLGFTVSADSGVYIVTVTNASGCTATDSITVIIFPEVPTPTISQSGDTLKCSSDPSYTSYQWYADTTLIPGATQSYVVVTKSGNYNVDVADMNGCSVAVGTNITITGIQTIAVMNDNLVSLSPNPVSDQLTIHASFLHGNEAITVSVVNVLGQISSFPFSLQMQGENAVIDVSRLPSGLYFLQLKSENGSFTKRFVKE